MVKTKKAFTLIELLVVVVIIGVLAIALVPKIASTQLRTRDAKRKTDFTAITQAIELYKNDNGGLYPPGGRGYYSSMSGGWWIPEMNNKYITSLPLDPINTGLFHYYYRGNSAFPFNGKQVYRLTTRLENEKDRARCVRSKYYIPYLQGGHEYRWYICSDPSYNGERDNDYVVSPHVYAEANQ